MPILNKLVRDKILAIIDSNGQQYTHKILNDDDYAEQLLNKLTEEVDEYKTDKTTEELADIIEVVYAIASLHGCSPEQLEAIRSKKAEARGSFEKKIFLIEVEG